MYRFDMSHADWITAVVVALAFFVPPAFGADLTVTNENDAGAGSLRAAIEQANSNFGSDTISFGRGVSVIQPVTQLPDLDDTTGGTTITSNRAVTLDGRLATGNGLTIESNNNAVIGMVIVDFSASGIRISQSSGNVVRGCWIGTDGATPNVGNGIGITIVGSPNTIIGGVTPEDRNVISGNTTNGILSLSYSSTNNVFQGNYVGTDVTGMFSLGNGEDGINIDQGHDNLIGGSLPGAGNVISGNGRDGIFAGFGSSTANRVHGNTIGLNAAQTAVRPNLANGVHLRGAGNTVGGSLPGEGNRIAGNGGHGILGVSSDNIVIRGNLIGLGPDGATPFGNAGHGILLDRCDGTEVGGLSAGSGNTIAANASAGIFIDTSHDVLVRGNRIGVAIDGVSPAGSQTKGVFVTFSYGVVVGGTVAAAANIIAYHTDQGIHAVAPEVGTLSIRRNAIHSNGIGGILFDPGVNPFTAIPVLTALEPVAGTGPALAAIELFADNGGQGRILIDTVQTTPTGAFTSTVDLAPFSGLNLTATATIDDGSTSAFSVPLQIGVAPLTHAADTVEDGVFSLSEILRVVQFYNAGGFGCEAGTEDGYDPGDPDQNCDAHSGDYDPQDWAISLSELLRLVQLFNAGGYAACPGEIPASEDGFCAGTI